MIITVDILISVNKEAVLLIKRAKAPFMDKYVMPGGHVEESDQGLKEACVREALEEIGFKAKCDELKILTVLDAPERDPRPGRRISVVFHIDLPNTERVKNCKAASDALSISLLKIDSLKSEDIGFDHYEAIKLLK